MPTSTVRMFIDVVTTSGQSRFFQASMNANRPSVARAGFASGKEMVQNTRQGPAPSIRAASSSSLGTVRKYCRIRKTPQTVTSSVLTKPAYVSIQPSVSIRRNLGISTTTAGTIIVDRYSRNSLSRPLNSNFAKA